MSKLLYIRLLFSLFISCAISCNKPTADSTIPLQSELKVDKTSIALSGDINAKDSFSIQSNIKWAIGVSSTSATWLSISTINGANNSKVFFTITESNTTEIPRVATVILSPSDNVSVQPITLIVTQSTSTINSPTASLLGKWSLVNDSLANIGVYYSISGGATYVPTAGNYIGTANDYLDFRENGKFYYREAGYIDSTTYQLLPNNKVAINNFQPGMDTASILNLTATRVTLYGTKTSANGGQVIKIINLRR